MCKLQYASSKKYTLEIVETVIYIQMHKYVSEVGIKTLKRYGKNKQNFMNVQLKSADNSY